MNEGLKLIMLRILVIPYFVVAFIATLFYAYVIISGYIILGPPCWALTGDAAYWVPDWDLDWYPFIDKWDDFKDDIKYRQQDYNREKRKKSK